MNHNDYFFAKMCKEALEDLTSGEHGTWREIPTNTLFLACIGMVYNSLMHKLANPLRWVAGSAVAAAIAYIVSAILGRL